MNVKQAKKMFNSKLKYKFNKTKRNFKRSNKTTYNVFHNYWSKHIHTTGASENLARDAYESNYKSIARQNVKYYKNNKKWTREDMKNPRSQYFITAAILLRSIGYNGRNNSSSKEMLNIKTLTKLGIIDPRMIRSFKDPKTKITFQNYMAKNKRKYNSSSRLAPNKELREAYALLDMINVNNIAHKDNVKANRKLRFARIMSDPKKRKAFESMPKKDRENLRNSQPRKDRKGRPSRFRLRMWKAYESGRPNSKPDDYKYKQTKAQKEDTGRHKSHRKFIQQYAINQNTDWIHKSTKYLKKHGYTDKGAKRKIIHEAISRYQKHPNTKSAYTNGYLTFYYYDEPIVGFHDRYPGSKIAKHYIHGASQFKRNVLKYNNKARQSNRNSETFYASKNGKATKHQNPKKPMMDPQAYAKIAGVSLEAQRRQGISEKQSIQRIKHVINSNPKYDTLSNRTALHHFSKDDQTYNKKQHKMNKAKEDTWHDYEDAYQKKHQQERPSKGSSKSSNASRKASSDYKKNPDYYKNGGDYNKYGMNIYSDPKGRFVDPTVDPDSIKPSKNNSNSGYSSSDNRHGNDYNGSGKSDDEPEI